MNNAAWLKRAESQLTLANIGTARLDALVLHEAATGKDRTHLLAHPEMELSEEELNLLNGWVERRAKHEPVAYLLGKSEFYGREFVVSPAVLEPRPESETMIDMLKNQVATLFGGKEFNLADVGTGSGALGITAKLELPGASVDLLEIDEAAIEVAKTNVIKFTTSISVIKSDLLAQTTQHYDVLLCNLPYVPDEHTINRAATHEPKIAIFGGPDGLDLYRKLFRQVKKLQNVPLLILTESLPAQHEALKQIAGQFGYQQTQEDDFIQAFASK